MRLAEYLSEVAGRRFAWGSTDCGTLMADWLMHCGLPDAMADLRGVYSTRAGWRRVSRAEGGMLALCRRRFAGLPETREPMAGDVALVMSPIMMRRARAIWAPVGAICVSAERRAFLTVKGLRIRPMPTVAAWRVNHG